MWSLVRYAINNENVPVTLCLSIRHISEHLEMELHMDSLFQEEQLRRLEKQEGQLRRLEKL